MTFEGLEASIDVKQCENGMWLMVMTAKAINFECAEPLHENFPNLPPIKQSYWTNRAFKLLEKQLCARIKELESKTLKLVPKGKP